MDPAFDQSYSQHVVRLQKSDIRYDRVATIINDISQTVLVPLGHTLRSDAQLFLLANFGLLVIEPWEEVTGKKLFLQHPNMIPDDVFVILQEVAKRTSTTSTEISAAQIIEVLPAVYSQLRVMTSLNWERP